VANRLGYPNEPKRLEAFVSGFQIELLSRGWPPFWGPRRVGYIHRARPGYPPNRRRRSQLVVSSRPRYSRHP
jgi:hypothetical protein